MPIATSLKINVIVSNFHSCMEQSIVNLMIVVAGICLKMIV